MEGWQEVGVPRVDVEARLLQRRQSAFRSPAAVYGGVTSGTQGPRPSVSAICRLIGCLIDRWGRLTRAWGFKWTPTALTGSIPHRQAA